MDEEIVYQPKETSVGGWTADLLGRLKEIETGEAHQSMDPLGNPFENDTEPEMMVRKFRSTFPSQGVLETLAVQLNSFYGVKEVDGVQQGNEPEIYVKTLEAIKKIQKEESERAANQPK